MHKKRQDYLAIVFRNIGFALFTPLATIIFQWLVFEKKIIGGHFYYCTSIFVLGLFFVAIGYIILKDKE